MLRLTDNVSRGLIKETFHLNHEWLAYFGEFMQYFLCKCARCYDILGHISTVLFQKHLQMSYLCLRPWYCMNPIHHPPVITEEGTPHLEYGKKDASWSCTALRGDTVLFDVFSGFSCSSLHSISLLPNEHEPFSVRLQWGTFYPFACTFSWCQEKNRRKLHIPMWPAWFLLLIRKIK